MPIALADQLKLWLANWHSKSQQPALDAYLSGQFQAFGRRHELVFGVSTSELQTNGPIYPGRHLDGYAALPVLSHRTVVHAINKFL